VHAGREIDHEDVERTVEAVSDATSVALTLERHQTLAAVVGRVLPGRLGPGAADAGVIAAVETALQHRSWRGMLPWIERALDQLSARAAARTGNEFCACPADVQDELLQGLERDPHPVLRVMFRSLVALSLEGLLGDPAHGGNRDGCGWTAIGLTLDDVRSGMCRGARSPDGRA